MGISDERYSFLTFTTFTLLISFTRKSVLQAACATTQKNSARSARCARIARCALWKTPQGLKPNRYMTSRHG